MTEHVHEWGMYKHKGGGATCKCGAVINNPTIEARLNATERLSAEDAIASAYEIKQHDYARLAKVWRYKDSEILHDALKAYADILERK